MQPRSAHIEATAVIRYEGHDAVLLARPSITAGTAIANSSVIPTEMSRLLPSWSNAGQWLSLMHSAPDWPPSTPGGKTRSY